MSSEFSPELRKELLDDFYAECDELLTNVRLGLAACELIVGGKQPEAGEVGFLFRHLHSLKGISAIVGLRAAEFLAHGMEDVLRGLSQRAFPLTIGVVELLLNSTQRLEQIVIAHRVSSAPPGIDDLLAELRELAPDSAPAPATSPTEQPADSSAEARARGLELWLCSFTPSKQLDERGVNLNSVRGRLGACGEILKATPLIRGKGAITFEFLVGFSRPPGDLAAWENDGVKLQRQQGAAVIAPTAVPADTISLTPSHMVRVDLARLDDLMRIASEMVIQRSRLDDQLQQSGWDATAAREVSTALGRSLRELREAIARVRLVPIAEVFTRIQFIVGDLVRETDQKVRIVLEGHQTEVDKYLVERLKEPLLHLVRNAVAHGIEPAGTRVAAGKPAEATIRLRAQSIGEHVLIQIADDGRGIDAEVVRARAESRGLAVPAQLTPADLLSILCTPGFSTRDEADLSAGRGVGMAVVANEVRELGGTLTLETKPGNGSEFSLRLPLMLSIAEAVIVSSGSNDCAVPQACLDEIIQVPSSQIRTIQQAEVIPYRGGLLPFLRLETFFGSTPAAGANLTLLVVSTERGTAGLAVDRVRSQREIVIRPLTDPLLRVPGISGATELGDGKPILILDPAAITRGVVRPLAGANSPTPNRSTHRVS